MINILLKIKGEKIVFLLFVFVVIFSVTIFSGCSGDRYPDALMAADSIADRNPKKVMAILDSIRPQIKDAGKAVKNYYDLLRIKANDKACVRHTSDTTILRLVDYYKKGGDKKLLPMAYYYAGCTYFDLNDYPEALKYCQAVVDVAGADDPLKYKAYSLMGSIFLYQDLCDKGIEAFTQACKYNEKVGNKENLVYELCGISDCYKKKKDEKSTFRYLNKALALSEEVGNKTMTHSILAQIARYYYRKKEYSIALTYIRRALDGVDTVNMRTVYSIAANIYKDTGNEDSVLFLCDALYKMDDVYAKHFASKNLGNYYLKKHDAPRALHYLSQYEFYSDSIQVITQTQAVAKANAIYNYQSMEKENARLKAKIKERKYLAFILFLLLVSSTFAYISYFLYAKKRRNDESVKMHRRMQFLRQKQEADKAFIEDNKKKIEKLNFDIRGLRNENERLQLDIAEERENLRNATNMAEIKIKMRMLSEESIHNTDIYKKFLAVCNNKTSDKDSKLSQADWDALDQEVNTHFPKFKERITEICKIDKHIYKVCLLLKIGMQPSSIASITNKSSNAISSTRKRLADRVLGGNNSPKVWDEFIRSL